MEGKFGELTRFGPRGPEHQFGERKFGELIDQPIDYSGISESSPESKDSRITSTKIQSCGPLGPGASVWRKKIWRINRSANRLLIISSNLDGFILANHRRFTKFANISPHQNIRYMRA